MAAPSSMFTFERYNCCGTIEVKSTPITEARVKDTFVDTLTIEDTVLDPRPDLASAPAQTPAPFTDIVRHFDSYLPVAGTSLLPTKPWEISQRLHKR
jgi:hypothetical protein